MTRREHEEASGLLLDRLPEIGAVGGTTKYTKKDGEYVCDFTYKGIHYIFYEVLEVIVFVNELDTIQLIRKQLMDLEIRIELLEG